jgi:glyoxylase-like metal-dependent hydrolase (beta-lactamase superfamily II)
MARPLNLGETNLLDAGADHTFRPDVVLADGDAVTGPGWGLTALATPGHCANHLAFVLDGSEVLLSGDHVMAWSTTIVAPPDGAMGDYMASLQKLLGRPETRYFPGHGNPVLEPQRFLRGLINHRRMREATIMKILAQGPTAIPALVAQVYAGLAPALVGAASLNTLAHLEDLVARALVETDSGTPSLSATYSLVGGARARVRNSSKKAPTRRALAPKS